MAGISSKVRLIIACSLLALLFFVVDLHQLGAALLNLRAVYLLHLALLSVLLIWISCVKWQLFIKGAGYHVPVTTLMKYYTMSYFYNMFLPSSLGGDMARSVQLGHKLQSYESAFAATFVERLTGFLAMILLGVCFVAAGSPATAGVEAAVLLVGFLALLGSLICFSPRLTSLSFSAAAGCWKMLGLRGASRVDALLARVSAAMAFARNDAQLFLKAMALSFAFHILAVVNTYVCALAVGWQAADFGSLCMVVPLVLLVSVAPITPSSIGVQEGAFVFFLKCVGASPAQGLGIALLLRAKNVVIALVGGLLIVFERIAREPQSEQAPSA